MAFTAGVYDGVNGRPAVGRFPAGGTAGVHYLTTLWQWQSVVSDRPAEILASFTLVGTPLMAVAAGDAEPLDGRSCNTFSPAGGTTVHNLAKLRH